MSELFVRCERKEVFRPLVLIVTGGRDYDDRAHVWGALDAVAAGREVLALYHGGAAGVDTLADNWCNEHRLLPTEHPADWARLGRRAGPRRNREMIAAAKAYAAEAHADLLLLAYPGGRGTTDCVAAAKQAGVEVRHV